MKHYLKASSGALAGTASIWLTACIFIGLSGPLASAAPKPDSINVIPTIENVSLVGTQLVATGTASVTRNGKTTTVPFSAPVSISVATNQPGACPILDLALGPINLDLLGLVVETSPICLNITAFQGGGLLGDLLCAVGNLLNGGLTIGQILNGVGLPGIPALTPIQVNALLGGITNLLNGALENLLDAIVTAIIDAVAGTCDILHLELGPLTLNLLGLQVVLDDCSGGPVVVDITGQRGRGNLLGNLLCALIGSNRAGLGGTLGQILSQLPGF